MHIEGLQVTGSNPKPNPTGHTLNPHMPVMHAPIPCVPYGPSCPTPKPNPTGHMLKRGS